MIRIRTGYSFRTAVGSIEDVLARLKEIGSPVAPITDRESTFGFVRWAKAAKKAELKPIYGVELACCPELGLNRPPADMWTFLAIDELEPLHKLIALATENPGKEPILKYEEALAAKGVVKIAGDRLLLAELPKKKAENFFVALSPSTPRGLFKEALKAKLQFIACSQNFYPAASDKEFYRVALGRRSDTQTYPMHILSDQEWIDCMAMVCGTSTHPEIAKALKNRAKVHGMCKAELLKAKLLIPEKTKTLRQLCEEGAQRTKTNLKDPVYKERLERELELIKQKNFEDYFFIIADLVNFAKKEMIVGPARGSSCGSLVCYLLNITTIDPIPYGLIFERFIDINRSDLPDIDIDFSDTRRHKLFEYAEKKFGADRVARLGTVGLFKARSALNQTGKALKIPTWMTDKVLDGVIERSSGDSRAMMTLIDTMEGSVAGEALLKEFPEAKIAARMEGHPNNASQHAAGIVVTDEPMIKYVAVDKRTGAVMCDKKDSEEINLLKIDALGLTQLSVFERVMNRIGKPDVSGWLETIPLDDQAAFDVLNEGKFAGIFQFNGQALRSIVGQVRVDRLDDIVTITALARPGPLATGGASSWVKRRMGHEKSDTIHPMLTDLTSDTYGVVVYQETVMRIVRELGKFSWSDTSAIRKAMSGRLGDEFFAKYWEAFKKGAKENGIEEGLAKLIWDQINTMGSWAFNKSHAVAYGIVSYYCCWLKAHYPLEFAAATLDAEEQPDKIIFMLRELEKEGIGYVPVDPETSSDQWEIKEQEDGKRVLVGPLWMIKGIGPAAVREILNSRLHNEPLRPALAKRLENSKTEIDTLYPIRDTIKRLWPDLTEANIFSEPTAIADVQPGQVVEVMVFACLTKIATKDENEAINVQKRGYEVNGPHWSLNIFARDDSGEIFCKINRFKFEKLAKSVIERGRPGKVLYAIKGTCPKDFRMISVDAIRYLGELGDEFGTTRWGGQQKENAANANAGVAG